MGQLQQSDKIRGYLLVATSSIGFGTLGLWGKWGYQAGFSPLGLLVLRFGIASAMLWGIVLLRYRRIPWPGVKGLLAFGLQGGVFYALTAGCYFQALQLLPAGLAAMLFYLHPLFTTTLAVFIWHERASRVQLAALASAVTGTALLAGGAIGGHLSAAGIMLILLAALSYSGFTLAGQLSKHFANALIACAYTTTACFLSLTLWARPSWHWLATLTGQQWGIGIGVATLATVVGILLFMAGVALIGASQTSIVAALEPASGVIFALLFLGERLTISQLAGMICILGSIVMLALATRAPMVAPDTAD